MAVVQTLIGNVKGPQGDTGATGPQGAQGEAATINVGTVSTTAYGNAAQVTNVGTESDAVLNFVIPQGKPGDKTTTMGGLTLDTITTQTADYPVPAVGDTGATAFGKIVKWFSDALAAITGKLDKANVVNNLTTTAEGYALDARQGKTLNTAITGKLDKANVVNNLTTTAGGYALDARQGKVLQDQFDKLGSFLQTLDFSTTGQKTSVQTAAAIAKYTYILVVGIYNEQIMCSTLVPRVIAAGNANRRHIYVSFEGGTKRYGDITFTDGNLTSATCGSISGLSTIRVWMIR